ncbi:HNH endonuclease signature motif containing protein [Clostridium sporogenes]|uniref:HNH endonuclease signature motif containing protein n=1 Tax=Clostridium sporogenes TaxID=1509 RepID=UPI00024BA2C5|nr:HNH endonuclease signature motif containing protein [Clostridium sporogenes]EHN17105.1 Phage protein [Clostridium sporogenes PA 3679]NFQ36282.1 HNH endonuclease [Clostridium sporogenes]NFQ61971.1 HNH endonuclease [Clostridium sporogenes]NFU11645.1 HNH endonuclease [Clostridium sporogenes]NFU45246.1 HNH endonuclease [Clostridium sporogenes]
MAHKYIKKQIEFIIKNVKGRSNKELTEMFNDKFGLSLKVSQIKSFKKNRKLDSGLNGQFKKGQEPWNKGIKGVYAKGCEKTWFKKGSTPINHRPVGSERITVDGYTEIKVAEPNKWRLKQQLIWEKYNGTIPKGYSILFGDGNKRNFDIDNLILVSRQQLLIMNRNKLIQTDADLTKTGLIIADIYQKIGQRKAEAK